MMTTAKPVKIIPAGLFLICIFSGLSYAENAPAPEKDSRSRGTSLQDTVIEGLSQKMVLDLRDMDIVDALKFLAVKGGINIIAGQGVTGRVSLFLKNVTIGDALRIILQANNLAYEKRGDILYVMTEVEYKALHGSNFKDARKVKIVQLVYAKPEGIFKTLELIKSDLGKLIVDEESGSVVMIDTPEKIVEMTNAVKSLDQVSVTKTFALQYAKAKDLQAILTNRLDVKKTGSIIADERNNQLVVTAFSSRMKEVEGLIKSMDRKTKQVLLEAKILKVILTDQHDMGVDWSKVLSQSKMLGLNFTQQFPIASTAAAASKFFQIGAGNGASDTTHNYSVIVKLLQEYGETRNLSSPSISVVNGEEAKIHVGRTEAYVTTTLATGSTTSSTAAQVTFLDTGVSLMVTPVINDLGFVSMKIKPEVSNVDGSLTYKIAADVDNTVPLVAKTSAETTVMIKDGNTMIIGGLRKDEKLKTVDKIPFAGDLPFIGHAFQHSHDQVEKSEIVVFITPHIMSGEMLSGNGELEPKQVMFKSKRSMNQEPEMVPERVSSEELPSAPVGLEPKKMRGYGK
ncbi:MAG: hypothetical protein COT00_04205 [Candidatus Omnitrophica bacterium CG07_land_8_20_14_0_80_50_8]|nr:MAG: hypothetical protein COT00_04205 [Candidatus Omnitrophica bacterium CG07_land_8_20_14_0_80_50_8]